MTSLSGFLNIDKPLALTSHDVVARLRRGLRLAKVGHAGTLDPLATGVLVLCLGSAARLSEYVMDTTKGYRARIHFGVSTTTYDAEGQITAQHDASHLTRQHIENALPAFLGDQQQIPPMYSAIKQGGRKLYDLARRGQTVERPPRPVHIAALTIVDWSPPALTLDVTCSAGTYIRSLAFDLGAALGVGAHLAGLVRTASGSFTLANAVALDALLISDNWPQFLLPADAPLAHWPAVHLDESEYACILHGRAIPASAAPDTLARAYAPDGRFVAVLLAGAGVWQPHKVFL